MLSNSFVEHRSSWIEFALGAAAITVTLGTILTAVRVPHAIANIRLFHIGSVLGDTDKSWMLLVWLSAAAFVALALALDRRSRAARFGVVLPNVCTAVALAGVLLCLTVAAWRNTDRALPDSWVGFGALNTTVGIVFALIVIALVIRVRVNSRGLLAVSLIIAGLLAIGPLFQTPDTFGSTGGNNSFTFDELLAPASGRLAGFDYVSQYQSLLGLPLAALAGVAPGWFSSDPEAFAVGWLVVLQLATFVIAILTVIRVSPSRVRWLIPLIVLPIAYLAGPNGLDYYAVLPMRLILPVILLSAIVFAGMRGLSHPARWWMPFGLGVIGGITATNNLDFGVPAALAGLITVMLAARRWRRAAHSGAVYAAGLVVPPALYVVIGTLTHGAYHLDYTLFFIRGFGLDNFNNVDMPVFGLHDGFVVLGVIGLIIGTLGARRRTGRNAVLHHGVLFQGALLLLTLVYYSGRSLTETLVTSEAFIAAVLFALLFAAGWAHLRILIKSGVRNWRVGDWTAATAIVLSLALPAAAWTFFPLGNVPVKIERAIKPAKGTALYLRPDPTAAIASLPTDVHLMGIVTVAGSAWSLRLGVRNADVFLNPYYFSFNGGADVECRYLAKLSGNSLLITRADLAVLFQSTTCKRVLVAGSARLVFPGSSADSRGPGWMLVSKR